MEIRNSLQNFNASSRRRITDLEFGYEFYSEHRGQNDLCLNIEYTPLAQDISGEFFNVDELSGNLRIDWGQLSSEINQKLEILERILASYLPSYEVSTAGDSPLIIRATIREVFCRYREKPHTSVPTQLSIIYFFPIESRRHTQVDLKWSKLSRSQQLAISNVASWIKKQAWQDLANKIRASSGQPMQAIRVHKVFLSYKQQSKAEPVAEIIANRLSQQNIEVWFDKWEIKSGDSVTGRIGEGFKNSDACLIFLESQYSSSDWCTKEMNTALTKAINEEFTIIPILIEDCEKPELLKDLKHISLKEPSAQEFEQKLTEITDSIYKVDLNPYR